MTAAIGAVILMILGGNKLILTLMLVSFILGIAIQFFKSH